MAILAIDPGTKTGGALFLDGAPIVFTLTSPSVFAIVRVIKWALAESNAPQRLDRESAESAKCRQILAPTDPSPLELVTEDQHVARGPRANPAATLSIARAAERWITIAELFGARTIQVQPSTWREPLIASVSKTMNGKVLDKKVRTKLLVQRLWSELELHKGEPATTPGRRVSTTKGKLPQDPIDAIAMGYWRMTKGAERPREKAPKKRNRTRVAKVVAT